MHATCYLCYLVKPGGLVVPLCPPNPGGRVLPPPPKPGGLVLPPVPGLPNDGGLDGIGGIGGRAGLYAGGVNGRRYTAG